MPKQRKLQPLQIYQLLPRTNCKSCGCRTCFAFAFALISRDKRLEDCPDIQTEAFLSSYHTLKTLLGNAEPIEGTAFTLDREVCTGCGDCISACERVIRYINPRGGVLYHRNSVPPVLQVIDGIIQVVNWDSCKRVMDPPDLCRVCADKCPFNALDLVK